MTQRFFYSKILIRSGGVICTSDVVHKYGIVILLWRNFV